MPLLAAGIFLAYLISAFLLMATVHAGAAWSHITLFGHSFETQHVHDIFFRYSVMGLCVVPAVFLLELMAVGWRDSSVRGLCRGEISGRSDLICYLLVHFRLMHWPQILLTFGFAIISGDMVHHFAVEHLGFDLPLARLPVWFAYPLFYLLYTFFDYVAHRVDHSDLFWPLHRFHHAADEFNVLTADRGHPASAITQGGLKIFPLALLGVPSQAIIDIGMLVVAIDYMNHSRIDWDYGWIGQYLIQSPRHHQLHHASDSDVVWNYSDCPLWDRLGGTWCDAPRARPPMGAEKPYRHGFNILPDLWRDYRDFLTGFWRLAPFRRRAK